MKTLLALALALFVGLATAQAEDYEPRPLTWARINVDVSLKDQRMRVEIIDEDARRTVYDWPVSTGRAGFETPPGRYDVVWADAEHRSSIYEDAPMPFAIFFHQGFAIHGTTEVRNLGRPASHGCVRLDPKNAEILYSAINDIGKFWTKIVIR